MHMRFYLTKLLTSDPHTHTRSHGYGIFNARSYSTSFCTLHAPLPPTAPPPPPLLFQLQLPHPLRQKLFQHKQKQQQLWRCGNNKSQTRIFTDLYILTHSMPRTLVAVFPALHYFSFFLIIPARPDWAYQEKFSPRNLQPKKKAI